MLQHPLEERQLHLERVLGRVGKVGGIGAGPERGGPEVSRHRDDAERRRPGVRRGDGRALERHVVRRPEEHDVADLRRPRSSTARYATAATGPE